MQVYADMVLNHTSGADAEEVNEYDGKNAGQNMMSEVASLPATGPAIILPGLKDGTMKVLKACPIFVTATLLFIVHWWSMHDG